MPDSGFWPQNADHVKGMLSENVIQGEETEYLELYSGTTWEAFVENLEQDEVRTPEEREHLFWFTPEFETAETYSRDGCKSYERAVKEEDSIVLEVRVPMEEINLQPPPKKSNGVNFHSDETITCEYPAFAAREYESNWIEAFYDITEEDRNFGYVILG